MDYERLGWLFVCLACSAVIGRQIIEYRQWRKWLNNQMNEDRNRMKFHHAQVEHWINNK